MLRFKNWYKNLLIRNKRYQDKIKIIFLILQIYLVTMKNSLQIQEELEFPLRMKKNLKIQRFFFNIYKH